MRQLATIQEKDVYPDREVPVDIRYEDRVTGKAILCDAEGRIALMGNTQNDFLQLPGGGIDTSEDIAEGIIRECVEETGCQAYILEEVGVIDDYRSRDGKHCINYCYLAKVKGEKGTPSHTKDEASIGMYTKWVTVQEAQEIFASQEEQLRQGKITFYNTGFNILRDHLFLKHAFPPSAPHA